MYSFNIIILIQGKHSRDQPNEEYSGIEKKSECNNEDDDDDEDPGK